MQRPTYRYTLAAVESVSLGVNPRPPSASLFLGRVHFGVLPHLVTLLHRLGRLSLLSHFVGDAITKNIHDTLQSPRWFVHLGEYLILVVANFLLLFGEIDLTLFLLVDKSLLRYLV